MTSTTLRDYQVRDRAGKMVTGSIEAETPGRGRHAS